MIDSKVKLVIWDLDDTFWQGTLSEEEITPVERNLDAVKELSRRGIINSICSKNDAERARAKLVEMGVYEYFVFPSIRFSPKGKAIAEIIEAAALRADNVLFLDDNVSNLEEAKFFNPGIMACHPEDVEALGGLLAHPQLAGKPDPELTRLKQYQFLQRKVEDRSTSGLSNEEFLRASQIKVVIDNDVDGNLDRVIDLINRSNQLNYTKKRLNTAEELETFKDLLTAFGVHAGCVFATDAYGDYGLIGFFLLLRRASVKKLVHFVFSCRTMHMGIEQYVYELLDKPELELVQPVSYGLVSHPVVDWINASGEDGHGIAESNRRRLVLLGGCDLLQLASYCSANRTEFVNRMEDDFKVRYDDPGFILSPRDSIRDCQSIQKIPCWTYEDATRFDEAVAMSELVLISMWPAMKGAYFRTRGGVMFHLTPELLKSLKIRSPEWLREETEEIPLDEAERLRLVAVSFDAVAERSRSGAQIFALGVYTRGKIGKIGRVRRLAYNDACRNYCEQNSKQFRYVDIDAIVPPESLVDRSHFSREGYFLLARHILSIAEASTDMGQRSLDAA